MTTTKSYSERSRFASLYRTAVKQRIPFGIITGILFALIIALPYFVVQAYDEGPSWDAFYTCERVRSFFSSGVYIAGEGQSVPVILVLMLLAMVGALTQSSFLHSKSRTDLYHSLPVKRPTLLAAGALAYLTVVFVPFLAIYLLTMVAQLIQYGNCLIGYTWYFQYIAIDLLCALTTFAAVYAFTIFISVNVGTTFDSFALTGVLGILPPAVFGIALAVWQSMTYGATDVFSECILWLSPFTFPFLRYVYDGIWSPRSTILPFLIWLLITAAICAAAVWCYNRRKSEIAEQTQTGGLFQTIAKCFAAFCGGALFYAIFNEPGGLPARLIASLVGAVLIGLIAELILSRGARALVKNLKWLASAGAFFCLVVIGVRIDISGYAARVPSPESVESVSINYRGRFEELSDSNRFNEGYTGMTVLTEPEAIAVVTGMHRMAVDNRPSADDGYSYDGDDDYTYGWVKLQYKLKNGSTLFRSYSTLYTDAYRKLADLEDKGEFIKSNHAVFFIEELAAGKATGAGLVNTVTVYDSIGGKGKPYNLSEADNARLLEAVRADLLAESLREIQNPSEPALGYLEFQFWSRPLAEYEASELPGAIPEYQTGTVILGKGYENTLSVMRALGLTEAFEEAPQVDEIQLYPASYVGGNHRVYSVTPRNALRTRAWGYGSDTEELVSSISGTDISSVMSVARNQMFMDDNDHEYDAFFVEYYNEQEQIGLQVVRYEDLPAPLQAQVREFYLIEKNDMYGYPVFAEEITLDAMTAGSDISIPISIHNPVD